MFVVRDVELGRLCRWRNVCVESDREDNLSRIVGRSDEAERHVRGWIDRSIDRSINHRRNKINLRASKGEWIRMRHLRYERRIETTCKQMAGLLLLPRRVRSIRRLKSSSSASSQFSWRQSGCNDCLLATSESIRWVSRNKTRTTNNGGCWATT
jgi:hypothetical protein